MERETELVLVRVVRGKVSEDGVEVGGLWEGQEGQIARLKAADGLPHPGQVGLVDEFQDNRREVLAEVVPDDGLAW